MSEELISCCFCGEVLQEIDGPHGGLYPACINRDCVVYAIPIMRCTPDEALRQRIAELEARLATATDALDRSQSVYAKLLEDYQKVKNGNK